MPPEFGRDVDRLLVLELRRELEPDEAEPPDAAAELADAVTALRLATAGAIAAGPVVFERLDFRPLRVAPLLPIAATQPRGEATRLDKIRARLAADLRERLLLADDDRELGEALDRWELSLFSEEPFRSGAGARGARPACSAATAGPGPRRCALPCCSARRRRERGRACSRRSAPSGCDRDARDACAARSSRRSCTATAPSSSRRSTRRCSVCGRGRRPSCASPESRLGWLVDRHAFGTEPAQTRDAALGYASVRWTRRTRVLAAAAADRGARARRRAPASAQASVLLDELRALVPEAEAWARAEGDARARAAVDETSGGGGRNAVGRTEMALVDGSRAPPSASQRSPCERAGPCRHAGDRAREPEGRRREDDDDAEPRRRVRRAGLSRCC